MLFAGLLLLFQDGTMDALLEGLQSDDPEVRTKAAGGLLEGWKRWTELDLAKLDEAADHRDPEIRGRASDAGSLIRIRRTLGETVVGKIPGADRAFHTGNDAAKLDVLAKANELWQRGELTGTQGLELLAASASWNNPKSLTAFLKRLEGKGSFAIPVDPRARARLRATEVERLGGEGKRRTGKVVEFLGDEAPEVRAAALRAIGGLDAKEQAAKVAALLKDGHAGVRGEAVALLGGWGSKEFAPDFVGLLDDPSGQIRWRAAEALAGWGQRDVAPRIAKLLKDPYAPSRAEAAAALGSLGAREFAPEIAPLLGDSQAIVRRCAAQAIGKLGARGSAGGVRKLLQDPSPDIRLTAAQSLGQLGSDLDALVPLLRDDDPEVREEAVWVLSRLGSKEILGRVADLLDDRDPEVRRGAVRALGRPVARLCTDPSAWVRAEAVRSLGRWGGKEDAETASARLRDPDRKVRIEAALALGELGGAGLPGLERDADRVLGLSATLSLIRGGSRGVAAQREALREIATDDVAFAVLGTAATETLSRIHAKESWDRLARPLVLRKPIETWKDLSEALSEAGLALDVRAPCAIGRLDERVPLTGREALDWLLGRLDAPAIVLEGRTLRLMGRRAALAVWQKRLDGR